MDRLPMDRLSMVHGDRYGSFYELGHTVTDGKMGYNQLTVGYRRWFP